MRVVVHAKPYAKQPRIERVSATEYTVHVDAPAQEGRANARLIALLAEHFGCSQSSIHIVAGATARRKMLEITM